VANGLIGRPRPNLVLVACLAGLLFALTAPTSGSAAVWVSNDGPAQLTMQDSNASARLDLRLHEYRLAFGDKAKRILVAKLMTGSFAIAPGEEDRCKHGRVPGIRRNSPPGIDPKRVECDISAVDSLFVGGGGTTDWVCVIEPTKQPFELTLDVHTQANHDSIAGGNGDDELNGGSGDDILLGRGGDDSLYGYEFPADDFGPIIANDDDHLFGGDGFDSLWGGPKADTIVGGPDSDPILCGSDGDADGAIHYEPGKLSFVPDKLMDNPAQTKEGLIDSFRRLLELDFDNLLLAHGAPAVGDGKQLLRDFVERGADS